MKLETRRTKSGEKITVGSGNVFADLELPQPKEMLLKAELAIEIRKLIEAKKLTQSEAAKRVGITQPNVSDILRGRLRGYSVERLLGIVNRLGRSVELRIAARDVPPEEARVLVTVAK